MIPGNLFSIVSNFSNYITDKIEEFYNIESFNDREEENQKRFIIKIIVYVILYVLLFYPLVYVPYKYIDANKDGSISYKIALFLTYLVFPMFNVIYMSSKLDKYQ